MTSDDVLAFVRRDWDAVRRHKAEFWAARWQREGPMPAWLVADELWQYARRMQPDYPTEASRAQDLADHLSLCDKLRRASRVLPRR